MAGSRFAFKQERAVRDTKIYEIKITVIPLKTLWESFRVILMSSMMPFFTRLPSPA